MRLFLIRAPREKRRASDKDFFLATNLARRGTQKSVPVADAKAKVIELIQGGAKVEEAVSVVGRSVETYRDWRKNDSEFKAAIDAIRSARAEEKETGRAEVPDFPEFCADWLKQPLHDHQYRILDAVEGREPRDMHPSMDFERGYENRVLVNVPPEHGKSTTFTVNYVVWLIHKNPDIRVVIVSSGADLAKSFLYEIKLKLTSPVYREMHLRFAPEGGWKDPDNSWTTDAIYVRGKNQNGVQKDPTVQVMGLKGTIYGRRADLIILDDAVVTKNAREIDLQMRLLDREIESRLPSEQEGGGLLLILGTRVAPMDLYRHLLEIKDADDERVWTYFRQPAVLDYGDGSSDSWVTLWPEKWNGKSLAKRRRDGSWNLIYQQLNVDEDMTFKAEAVDASIEGRRFPGPMAAGAMGHRPEGMNGLYLVGGLDPAASGNTAIIIAGLDRTTLKRYVIDGWNKPNASAGEIIEKFKHFTEVYQLNEWVVERNAFQRFLAQLPEIVDFARARGCRITEHYTTANKFDSDWGVQTMAPLFNSCGSPDPNNPSGKWKRNPDGLIELPNPRQNAWVHDLIQQLTVWQPEGLSQKQKTDLVMALWFTHIAFQSVIKRMHKRTQTHMQTPFMTGASRGRQGVIDLAALRREKRERELMEGTG